MSIILCLISFSDEYGVIYILINSSIKIDKLVTQKIILVLISYIKWSDLPEAHKIINSLSFLSLLMFINTRLIKKGRSVLLIEKILGSNNRIT